MNSKYKKHYNPVKRVIWHVKIKYKNNYNKENNFEYFFLMHKSEYTDDSHKFQVLSVGIKCISHKHRF